MILREKVVFWQIESLTWWRRDCDSKGSNQDSSWSSDWIIDLMKKGLRRFFATLNTDKNISRLNHWPDEEGIATLSFCTILIRSSAIESLTWWRRDCDVVLQIASWSNNCDWIIDLMKKGLRQFWNFLGKINKCLIESLTWWRRDCDLKFFFVNVLHFVADWIIDLMKKGLRQ